jgi:hypothetical protein
MANRAIGLVGEYKADDYCLILVRRYRYPHCVPRGTIANDPIKFVHKGSSGNTAYRLIKGGPASPLASPLPTSEGLRHRSGLPASPS